MILSTQIELQSDGRFNVIVLTDQVNEFVRASGLQNGLVTVFLQHTTGSVIIDEYDAGILADMQDMFERIAPSDYPYKHHMRGVDFNGHAHMRTALMQAGVTVPLIQGKLALGTYQDILVIDDQVDQDPRYVVLQVMGE
jgi:secondary thiamine-phosphate synthase enzyme